MERSVLPAKKAKKLSEPSWMDRSKGCTEAEDGGGGVEVVDMVGVEVASAAPVLVAVAVVVAVVVALASVALASTSIALSTLLLSSITTSVPSSGILWCLVTSVVVVAVPVNTSSFD